MEHQNADSLSRLRDPFIVIGQEVRYKIFRVVAVHFVGGHIGNGQGLMKTSMMSSPYLSEVLI